MRIVFFTHRYAPDVGGVELSVEKTAAALRARGHEVYIVTESAAAAFCADEEFVVRLSVRPAWPVTRVRYWMALKAHADLLRSADVLHFHDYGTFVHWFLPLKFVFRSAVYAMTFHGFDGWPVKLHHRMFRTFAAWNMDCTFGVGSYISKYYGHRIDHFFIGAPVHSAVNTSPQSPTPRIACISRLASDTGALEALRAVADAAIHSGREVVISCVGNEDYTSLINPHASPAVTVLMQPPTRDVAPLLAQSSCVIATGFLAILDAFASERPVLIPALTDIKRTYVASIPDVESYAAVTASHETLAEQADEIVRTGAPSLPADALVNAAAFAHSLTWDSIARLHEDAYSHTLLAELS